MMADVLRKHLELKKLLSGEMWLAGREIRTNVWQWLNGRPFANQSLFGSRPTHFVTSFMIQFLVSLLEVDNECTPIYGLLI